MATSSTGNVINAGNFSGLYGNPTGVTQSGSNYSNANVINFLPIYSGNLGAVNSITASGNIVGQSVVANVFMWANGTPLVQPEGYGNSNVAAWLPTNTNANILAPNLSVTGTANIATIRTNNYQFANGQPLSFSVNYSNANVAAYLPTYTGNLSGGNLFLSGRANVGNVSSTGTVTAPNLTAGNAINTDDLFVLGNSNASVLRSYDAFTGIDMFPANGVVNIHSNVVAGNVFGNYFFANGTPFSSYGNSNVAAYLPTYTGNVGAGNVNVTSNVTAFVVQTTGVGGDITGANNITANAFFSYGNAAVAGIKTDNYYYANGTPVSFSGGGYGNTQVAAFLPTYTGNLSPGNIMTNNYLYANGQPFTPGTNYSNANVAAYLPTDPTIISIKGNASNTNSNVANLTTSVTGITANVTSLTGALSNTNSNVNLLDITVTGITGNVTTLQGNVVSLTGALANTDANVSGLTSALSNTNSNVSNTNSNVATLTTSVTGITANVTSLTGALSNTNSNVSNNSSNITTLQTQVSSLTGNVNTYGNANVAAYLPTYTGNINSDYVFGNGYYLTGLNIPAGYGNANVAAYLPTDPTIISIESSISNTNSNVSNLSNIVASNSNDIITLQGNVANLSTGLSNVNANVANTDSNVANIVIELSSTNANVSNLTTSIANTNSNVANTDSNVANLTTSVAGITLDLANTNSNVANTDSNVANVITSVVDLTSTVGNNSSNIASLQGQVTSLSGNVYANANVISVLETYSGSLAAGSISTTGNIVTDGYFVGNFVGNITGNLTVPGSNTQVLFNSNGNAGAAQGLTYDSDSNTLAVLGAVTATGNVYSNAFVFGNAAYMTGIPEQYGNANVEAYLPTSNVIIGIDANVANTNSNVANLTTSVTGITFDLADTNSNVAATNSNVANIVIDLAATNSNVANISADVSNLTTSLANTNSNVSAVYISLTGVASDLANTAGNVGNLTVALANTNSNVANLQVQVSSLTGNTYGNANVAAYLPTYTGNLAGGNLSVSGAIQATTISAVGNVNLFGANATIGTTNGRGTIIIGGGDPQGNPRSINIGNTTATGTQSINIGPTISGGGVLFNAGTTVRIANTSGTALSVAGNTTVANLQTVGNITATGNIQGSYILGNGAFLTGLPESYGNANVAAYLPTYTGNLSPGNLTTSNILGDNVNALTLTANNNSTGDIHLNAGNIRFGKNNQTANISTRGTGNMIISTNEGDAVEGNITLVNGAGGNIQLNPNGVGIVTVSKGVSAVGNIQGSYILGNGAFLTGLPAQYSNADVAAYLPTDPTIISIQSNAANTNSNVANLTTSVTGITLDLANTNSNVANTDSNVANLTTSVTGITSNLANTNSNVANNSSNITTLQGQVYTNANTAAYLATATGTISATDIAVSNTVTATTFIGNFQGNITGNLVVPGSNGWLIYNNAGNAGADVGLQYLVSNKSLSVTGNVVSNAYVFGNAAFMTGIPAQYGNANVAAYIPSDPYIANLSTSVSGITVALFNTNSNVTSLTGASSNTNSNVANTNSNVANLTTSVTGITGNVANLTTSVTGLTSALANTNSNVANVNSIAANNSSNISILQTSVTGIISTQANTDANVSNLTISVTGLTSALGNTDSNVANLTTSVTGIAADVANLQGQSYTNANVAAYLPTYTGNLTAGNAVISGNLQVLGNTITVNATTLSVDNVRITAGDTTTTPSALDTGGFYLGNNQGGNTAVASMIYTNTGNAWLMNIGLSSAGNVVGANIATAGLITATGNIQGGNLRTTGNVSVSGQVQSLSVYTTNISAVGLITATGNIQGGNLRTAGGVSATGSIQSQSLAVGSGGASFNSAITAAVGINVTGSANVNGTISASGAIISGASYVSLGTSAGNGANNYTTSIGYFAGSQNQGQSGIAVGYNAAQAGQGTAGIAIGQRAGTTNQGSYSVAIGTDAGKSAQGANSIAIGFGAGYSGTGINSIVISTSSLLGTTADALYINPIRPDATPDNILFYNTATKEVTTGSAPVSYSNANVASYLLTNTGNIAAGNIDVISNVTANVLSTTGGQGNVSGANVVGAVTLSASGMVYGNGYYMTGVQGSYTNANVASYLATATGTISGSSLTIAGAVQAGTIQTNTYLWANGLPIDSQGFYGNPQVANYLPVYSGNINSVNNIIANNVQVNGTLTTVNTTNLNVSNIQIGVGTNENTASLLNTAGLVVGNTTGNTPVATMLYNYGSNAWQPSLDFVPISNTGKNLGSSALYWGNTYTNSLLGNVVSVAGQVRAGSLYLTGGTISTVGSSACVIMGGAALALGVGSMQLSVTGALTTLSAGNLLLAAGDFYPNQGIVGRGTMNAGSQTILAGSSVGYGVDAVASAGTQSNVRIATSTGNGLVSIMRGGMAGTVMAQFANTGASISGNVTTGNVSVTGNVSGTYILGNIAFATGTAAAYGNSNVAAYLPVYTGNITAATISASGNIYTTSLLGATISVTGGVTAVNYTASGQMIATGNVTGGNINTGGVISATGGITAGGVISGAQLSTNGLVTATGNVQAANFRTGGQVSATGAITGASLSVVGSITAPAATYSTSVLISGAYGMYSGATNNDTMAANKTSGTVLIGSSGMTGNLTVGQSVSTGNLNLGTGITSAANFKNIYLGTFGAAGSNTVISVGPTSGLGNVTFNANTTVAIANAGGIALSAVGNVVAGNLVSVGSMSASGAVVANASASIAFVSGPGAASNVALLIQPPTNGTTPANQAIRDLSAPNSIMYFDVGMGGANTGHQFQFRASNAFTNYATITSSGIQAKTPYITKTSWNAAADSEITVGDYRFRINNNAGTVYPQVISNISGTSINTGWTCVSAISGQAVAQAGSTGTSVSNGSWTSLYTLASMNSAADTIVATIQQKSAGRIYRVTFMRSDNGTTTGYNIIAEQLL